MNPKDQKIVALLDFVCANLPHANLAHDSIMFRALHVIAGMEPCDFVRTNDRVKSFAALTDSDIRSRLVMSALSLSKKKHPAFIDFKNLLRKQSPCFAEFVKNLFKTDIETYLKRCEEQRLGTMIPQSKLLDFFADRDANPATELVIRYNWNGRLQTARAKLFDCTISPIGLDDFELRFKFETFDDRGKREVQRWIRQSQTQFEVRVAPEE
jgi:hypothetical protein